MRQIHAAVMQLLFSIVGLLVGYSYGWTWRCENSNCVQGVDPVEPMITETLEVCRLTCGIYGALWPRPTGPTSISKPVVEVNPSKIHFNYSAVAGGDDASQLLTAMSRLFVDNLLHTCKANCSLSSDVTVIIEYTVVSSDLDLSWDTDESYFVRVLTTEKEVRVSIQAKTVYGARHGLESVSQLIAASGDQLVIVSAVSVHDKPSYAHRGLLLDTARNYLPLSTIKRTVDAMSACKLNVLHWHVTDSHSFPLVLPRVPELARYGAYSSELVYSTDDLEMIVTYARVRGIHVMMELDGPAHAGNGWQWGPDHGLGTLALCVNRDPWRQSCMQPPCGQLNPANPNLYRVLRDVFRDLQDKLPSGEIFHLGGDEVFIPCWNQSKEVTDWMSTRGMDLSISNFLDVWGEYHQRVLEAWDNEAGNSKTNVLLWTSHLTTPTIIEKYLRKDRYVIESWTDASDPTAEKLLLMGYRVIFATNDAWYLDHGFWGGTRYYKWQDAYDNVLPNSVGVLGGEAVMWGELVDDYNLDMKVWPRAAAIAERLWSNPKTKSSAAVNRMLEFRQRLINRGINPEAISPRWCAQNEGSCLGSANIS